MNYDCAFLVVLSPFIRGIWASGIRLRICLPIMNNDNSNNDSFETCSGLQLTTFTSPYSRRRLNSYVRSLDPWQPMGLESHRLQMANSRAAEEDASIHEYIRIYI